MAEWKLGEQILTQILDGVAADAAQQRVWRTGSLPPGKLGWSRLQRITHAADQVAQGVLNARAGADRTSLDLRLDLGKGLRVTGAVTDVFADNRVWGTYSKLKEKHWLDLWIPHLALAAAHPELAITSGIFGRSKGSQPMSWARLQPINDPGEARTHLRRLVELYQAGMQEPLLLPMATAKDWVANIGKKNQREWVARTWSGGHFGGDSSEPEYTLIWGPGLPFIELLAQNPDFDQQARMVWQPLLNAIEVSSR